MKKISFIPFKYKLGFIMSALVSFAVILLGTMFYFDMRYILQEQYIKNQYYIENEVINSLEESDITYYIWERYLSSIMESATDKVQMEYEKVNDPKNIDLSTFSTFSNEIDVYIINPQNIILYSTDSSFIENDFKNNKYYYDFITQNEQNDDYFKKRTELSYANTNTKRYMFSYTKDRKYIIGVSINMKQFYDVIQEINFEYAVNNIIISNSSIEKIGLYDLYGETYYSKNNIEDETTDFNKISFLKQAIDENKTIEKIINKDDKVLQYKYIPYEIFRDPSNKTKAVIEIVFNNNILENSLRKMLLFITIALFIFIIISIFLGIIIAGYISKPIQKMMQGIEEISKGNFDNRINIKSNDEFKLLGKNFNNMVQHIKKLIEERNYREKELNNKNYEILSQTDKINALYEETTQMNKKLEYLLNENQTNYFATVRALVNSIEAKDRYTRGHCERVMEYSVAIGEAMGLSEDEIVDLRYAALLHDVGKIGIPSKIINKSSKLTNEEMELIQIHPRLGFEILKDVLFLKKAREAILQHHERVDGKGYPNKLKGKDICIMAKILAVADAFDAMTTGRSYRTIPLTKEMTLEQLEKNKGLQFDPEIVDLFVMLIEKNSIEDVFKNIV